MSVRSPKTVFVRTPAWATVALSVVIVSVPGCATVNWQSRVEPALQRAGSLNQLVLVQFRTLTDPACMDADVALFSNQEVVKALKSFQCVRLDYVLNKKRADDWGVSVVPTYLILRPNGTQIDRRAGMMDPDEFRFFLNWASIRR
jgi:hypothetical protein